MRSVPNFYAFCRKYLCQISHQVRSQGNNDERARIRFILKPRHLARPHLQRRLGRRHGWHTELIEPATGQTLGHAGLACVTDIVAASQAARVAQPAWAAMEYKARAGIFRKAAAFIERHNEELSAWIVRETGGIMPKAQVELREAVTHLHEAAAMLTQPKGQLLASGHDQLSIARRVPHGVVGVISPFNFPLILSIRSIAPALAVGNAVVHKPDIQTPITGGYIICPHL